MRCERFQVVWELTEVQERLFIIPRPGVGDFAVAAAATASMTAVEEASHANAPVVPFLADA